MGRRVESFAFIGGGGGTKRHPRYEWFKGIPHAPLIERWRSNRARKDPLPVYYFGDTLVDAQVAREIGARKMFMRIGTLTGAQVQRIARESKDLEI